MMSTTKLGKALVVCLFLNFFLTIAIGVAVVLEHKQTREVIKALESSHGAAGSIGCEDPSMARRLPGF